MVARFLFLGQAGSCCIGLYSLKKRYLVLIRGPFELINVFLSTNIALNLYKLTELDVSQNQNSDTLNSDLFLKGLFSLQSWLPSCQEFFLKKPFPEVAIAARIEKPPCQWKNKGKRRERN